VGQAEVILCATEPNVREVLAAKTRQLRLLDAPLAYPGDLKQIMDESLQGQN